MATLIIEKDGVTTKYKITEQQAIDLQGFKENDKYAGDTVINGVMKSEMVGIEFDKKPEKPFYYNVRLSFNDAGQDVSVTKEELPMVLWAFTRDTKAICNGGAFRGKDIISILPDYTAILGFNKGYELQPEDFRVIGNDPVCFQARDFMNNTKRMCLESANYQELKGKVKTLLLN